MPRPSLAEIFGVRDTRPPLEKIFGRSYTDADEDEQTELKRRLAEKKRQMEIARQQGDLGAVEAPDTSLGAVAREALKTTGTAWAKNLVTAPEQVETVLALPGAAIRKLVTGKLDLGPLVTQQGDLGRLTEEVSGLHQRQTERLAEAAQDLPAPVSSAIYGAAELGAGLLDPTNLPLGGAASRVPRGTLAEAAMAKRVAGKTPGVLEALAESAELRPEAGEIRLPKWLRDAGEDPLQGGPHKDLREAEAALGMRASPEEAGSLLAPELIGPPAPPRTFDDLADEAMARLGRPIGENPPSAPAGATIPGGPGLPPPPGPIGPPGGAGAPLGPRPRMSTKALRNVAGMQQEFGELIDRNWNTIYAARGEPTKVSVWHDARGLADELQMLPEDFLHLPKDRPPLDDREVSLARHFLGGMKQEINGLTAKLAAGEIPPAQRAAAVARLAEMDVDTVRMAAVIQGQGLSIAGRVLRSGQEALDPFAIADTAKERLRLALINRYRRQLEDDDVLKRIALIDPNEPGDLIGFLRTMERPKFRDYAASYWYGSILSGPKTLVRNAVGNAVKLTVDTGMRAVTPLVYRAAPGLEGQRYFREVAPATAGLFAGMPKGLQRFAYVVRNGYDPERLVADLVGKRAEKYAPVDAFVLSGNANVRRAGAALNYGPRLLEATDALFKSLAETSERYAWATRKAITENAPDVAGRASQLLAEQPEEMVRAAKAFAARATYTDPMSWVGRDLSLVRKHMGIVGDHLVPFIHVSDRVAAAITDFIPGSKPRHLRDLVKARGPEAADLIARQAVGGVLAMGALTLASSGRLVGAAPKDEALRNDFYAEGKQPYSVLLGGEWRPIRDVLGPLAGPFVAAAALHDHYQTGETVGPEQALDFSLSTARFMLDASYLKTIQDVFSSIEDGGGEGMGKGITRAGTRIVGGYNPWSGLQRGIATATDLGPGGNPRVVEKETPLDELKAGIPGLRNTLPPRLDSMDNPLEISTGRAGAFNPLQPTESKIVDPGLTEDIGRLRFTVATKRRELAKIEQAIVDARRAKDPERAASLKATLPARSAVGDAALERVRGLEERIRVLRVSGRSPEAKRAVELQLQARMQEILRRALERMGGQPGEYAPPARPSLEEIFAQ